MPFDNPYEVIRRYVLGQTSPDEERDILLWIESSEENLRFFSEIAQNISLHETMTDSVTEADADQMISRLDARIETRESRHRETWSKLRKPATWLAVAAAAIGLMVAIPSLMYRSSDDNRQMYYVANNGTTPKNIVLSDRTSVCLQPGAEIRYDVSSRPDDREVILEGEAYFDVARDTLRPFTVQTRNISVRVLGTAFCVRTSLAEPDTEVLLERGSVRIVSPQGINLVDLIPNQSARFDAANSTIKVEQVNALPYIAEHYNMITLEDATLNDILYSIQNCYGIKVNCNSTSYDRNKRYHFNYLRNDNPSDVLSALKYLTGITITQNK